MKQLSSMAGVPSHRSSATEARRSGEGAARVLAVVAGLPIVIGFFLSSSDAALAQVGMQAAVSLRTDSALDSLKDRDGDGLDNALELSQYSAADRVDTDHDGWNDAEELARGSLATAYASQPANLPVSIGAGAYMRNGKLHVALATYIRSGSLENARLDIGILALKRMIPLAPSSYIQHMTVTTVPTHNPGELVMVTDIIVPSAPLLRTGRMSIYATLQVGDFMKDATAVNLELRNGLPMALISPAQLAPNAGEQLGPGLLRRPLGGTHIPASWASGEICFQHLESVGSHGAVSTQEVSYATCITGWDGYCDAMSCASSVGTTVDLVDPAALIGG